MELEKSELTPLDLIERFSRSANYPRTLEGIQFLAQGLAAASQSTGVEIDIIAAKCAEISAYCPTDHEFLNVAKGIREERQRAIESRRNKTAEWEAQIGPPQDYSWKQEAAKIMPFVAEAWKKRRAMVKLMRQKAAKLGVKDLSKMSHAESFRLQLECQREVGLPVKPEQLKELQRLG